MVKFVQIVLFIIFLPILIPILLIGGLILLIFFPDPHKEKDYRYYKDQYK